MPSFSRRCSLAFVALCAFARPALAAHDRATPAPLRVLVATAHPDDETMMSGALDALRRSGAQIRVVTMTSGEQGKMLVRDAHGHARHDADGKLVEASRPPAEVTRVREHELRRSMRVLGVKRVTRLRVPDVALRGANGQPSQDYTREHTVHTLGQATVDHVEASIVRETQEFRPDVIVTLLPDKGHWAHRAAADTVLALHRSGRIDRGIQVVGTEETEWYPRETYADYEGREIPFATRGTTHYDAADFLRRGYRSQSPSEQAPGDVERYVHLAGETHVFETAIETASARGSSRNALVRAARRYVALPLRAAGLGRRPEDVLDGVGSHAAPPRAASVSSRVRARIGARVVARGARVRATTRPFAPRR